LLTVWLALRLKTVPGSHIAYITRFREDAHTSTKYEFRSCFKHAQHFLQLVIKLLGNRRGEDLSGKVEVDETTPDS